MAKAPPRPAAAAPAAAPAPAPVAAPAAAAPTASPPDATLLPYQIEVGAAPPERTRTFTPGEPSPFKALFQNMPAPVNGAYASVFVPAEAVPATVTDAGEREKAYKESSRKRLNNLSSITRSIKKADASYNFTAREVTEKGERGVRIWRIEPAPAAAPATA